MYTLVELCCWGVDKLELSDRSDRPWDNADRRRSISREMLGKQFLAVLPDRDPLQLTECGRMLYVYAAEAVFALIFLHIYLTKTELFRGFFRPYWPLIVMGIAYFGVGVGELFQRKRLRVLAEPL